MRGEPRQVGDQLREHALNGLQITEKPLSHLCGEIAEIGRDQ
jgi:hypothetical protein